jgi:hypothetical protein
VGLLIASALGGMAVAADGDKDTKKPVIKRERIEDDGPNRPKSRRVLILQDVERHDAKDAKGDRKGEVTEEIVERYVIVRDGEPDRVIERKQLSRAGKPITEQELGIETEGDVRKMAELTSLVKRLSAQVERLQDEVAELRGKSRKNQPLELKERSRLEDREKDETSQLDRQRNELRLAAEKVEAAHRAIAEKQEILARQAAKVQDEESKKRAELQEMKKRIEAKFEQATAEKQRAAADKERAASEKERAAEEKERGAEGEAKKERAELKKTSSELLEKLKRVKEGKTVTDSEVDLNPKAKFKALQREEKALIK